MRLLQKLKDGADILLCIFAGDIERKKVRADFGITYDVDALKLIDDLSDWGLGVRGVVITRFENQPSARVFKNKLERRGIRVYTHAFTKGYPTDVDMIVSDAGYGANEYIETEKPLVVVTGPGPGSGKLATCLSQLYHDYRRGLKSGYAKFETFPIWNLPLKHPVNVAYEAATADIRDFNLVDPFHLEAYGKVAINYNRDVEVFPVLRRILEKITGDGRSLQVAHGHGRQPGRVRDRPRRRRPRGGPPGAHPPLFPLPLRIRHGLRRQGDGRARRAHHAGDERRPRRPPRGRAGPGGGRGGPGQGQGQQGDLLRGGDRAPRRDDRHGRELAPDARRLEPDPERDQDGSPRSPTRSPCSRRRPSNPSAISRRTSSGAKAASLDVEEVLISLSLNAAANPMAQIALEKLKDLRGCEVHMTHIPTPGDEAGLKRLGLNLTSDSNFSSKDLFVT